MVFVDIITYYIVLASASSSDALITSSLANELERISIDIEKRN